MLEIRHEPVARTVGWQLEAGHTIDRHRHDDHQLVYVSAGVLEVQTPAGSWVVSRDRAVWLPAGTWHEHRFHGSSSFYTVGFPTSDPPWLEPDPALISVSPLLRELLIACVDPALTDAEIVRVRAVIGDQLRRSSQRPVTFSMPHDARLADACAAVGERLDRQLSLGELAARVGTSETTLSRLFRQELGMTYPRWRTSLRLFNAMILLSGGTAVTETAHECGWQTTSAFIDSFRRAMGQTPGAYRRGSVVGSAPAPGSDGGAVR